MTTNNQVVCIEVTSHSACKEAGTYCPMPPTANLQNACNPGTNTNEFILSRSLIQVSYTSLFTVVTKCLKSSTKEGFLLAQFEKMQSVLVGKTWLPECEAESRGTNAGIHLTSVFLIHSVLHPVHGCCYLGSDLSSLLNLFGNTLSNAPRCAFQGQLQMYRTWQ